VAAGVLGVGRQRSHFPDGTSNRAELDAANEGSEDQNNGQTGNADGQTADGDKSASDGGDAAGSGLGDGAAEPAITTEVEAPKQEEHKPPAEPDLSKFDLDELADGNQHSGSLGSGQFVSAAVQVAKMDAFEDRTQRPPPGCHGAQLNWCARRRWR